MLSSSSFVTLMRSSSIPMRAMILQQSLSATVASWCASSLSSRHFSTTSTTTINNKENNNVPSLQLYQYAICPFCSKAKAVLDYANVPYQSIEVNPLTKAEIKWSTDYRKVPIAKLLLKNDHHNKNNNSNDDNVVIWKGSDTIVKELLSLDTVQHQLQQKWQGTDMTMDDFSASSSSSSSSSSSENNPTTDWTAFTNDTLAPLLYPNICATLSDSYTAFGYVNGESTFTWMQKQSIRTLGAVAMYFAASRVKQRMNITDERAALEQALRQIDSALKNAPFLSGKTEPNVGDLAVYGALRSIQGLPAHQRILGHDDDDDGADNDHHHRPLKDWYARMQSKVVPTGSTTA